jgi:hypothetical protein
MIDGLLRQRTFRLLSFVLGLVFSQLEVTELSTLQKGTNAYSTDFNSHHHTGGRTEKEPFWHTSILAKYTNTHHRWVSTSNFLRPLFPLILLHIGCQPMRADQRLRHKQKKTKQSSPRKFSRLRAPILRRDSSPETASATTSRDCLTVGQILQTVRSATHAIGASRSLHGSALHGVGHSCVAVLLIR